jgi:hypothetical protein
MAYQVDIEFDFDRTPFEDAFGGQSLRFILGQDLTAEMMVVMDVAFICKERGIYDLRFGVDEISLSREGFHSGMDYSIEYSKRYVPHPHRPEVLRLLLQAIECILRKTKPKKLTMQSFYGQLPDKALRKYDRICEVMDGNGYKVADHFRGTNGVHYWLFSPK